MDPIRFRGMDRVLGAPPAWDQSDTQCTPLGVKFDQVNGLPALTSYWRPTEEEIAQLAGGACVKFTIVGAGQPPVMLQVESVEEMER